MNSKGDLEFKGTFRDTQPIRYRFFNWLRKTHLGEKLGFDIPPRITDSDYELIVKILQKLEKETHDRFPSSEFYLVLYPEPGRQPAQHAHDILKAAFAHSTIRVIDYVDRPTGLPPDRLKLADGHPSPEMYRLLAGWLKKDLGLNLNSERLVPTDE